MDEESAFEGLKEQLESLKQDVDNKRSVLDERRNILQNMRMEHQQVQRDQFEAEKKVAVADTSIQNLQRVIHQLEEETLQREELQQKLEVERVQKEQLLTEQKQSLEQLQAHHDHTKEQILQTQSILEELRNELAEENRKLDAKKNEHDLLKSMIDSMEGYPDSVKYLHNNPDWNHQSPILSDILYVKEEYRTALENVLEPYLNYYVVSDLQQGLQAVHLLDENKKGKANFFLLNKINATSIVEGASLTGAISALSVIEVEEKYKNLAEHLLNNVFIAEGEEALNNSNGYIVIEKNGKYVKGKYTLTGGSVGLIEGKKIGRVKNLEKLQEVIAAQDLIVQELRAKIQARHNEVIAFNEDLRENAIKQTENEIRELSNQVFSLQNKLENILGQQSVSRNRMEELGVQLLGTQSSVEDVRKQLAELNETLQLNANKLSQADEEFKSAETEYGQASAQFNEFNINVTRQQSKVNALKQELDFKTNQLRDLKVQVEQSAGQLNDTHKNISESELNQKNIEEELLQLMRSREEDKSALDEADQSYYNYRNQLNEKESALRLKSREKEQVEHQLAAIKDKLNDLKLQLAGTRERLNVEFKIQLEDILDEARTSETAVEELQEKADRLKKRLENLGEVNPTAIEAFTEMKKRYEFIVEQKNDLVNAKISLLKTIEEVEATANQKFLDTFNLVRENFKKVFKSLFTEDDQCDLILENPENLAETGIDVLAKPKGKRPSSLTQLSGGERTLTATALLFAIYLIKPAPFCILDEVDAPLDDANVGKFTNMIREFSDNSQFIIVTHNKTTMSTVDVIYGVTMQEPGVSKLVSVDFRSLASVSQN